MTSGCRWVSTLRVYGPVSMMDSCSVWSLCDWSLYTGQLWTRNVGDGNRNAGTRHQSLLGDNISTEDEELYHWLWPVDRLPGALRYHQGFCRCLPLLSAYNPSLRWVVWLTYLPLSQTFNGNTDQNTSVTNMLANPMAAYYLRLYPRTYEKKIGLRLEVLGCLSGKPSYFLLSLPLALFWW